MSGLILFVILALFFTLPLWIDDLNPNIRRCKKLAAKIERIAPIFERVGDMENAENCRKVAHLFLTYSQQKYGLRDAKRKA